MYAQVLLLCFPIEQSVTEGNNVTAAHLLTDFPFKNHFLSGIHLKAVQHRTTRCHCHTESLSQSLLNGYNLYAV